MSYIRKTFNNLLKIEIKQRLIIHLHIFAMYVENIKSLLLVINSLLETEPH